MVSEHFSYPSTEQAVNKTSYIHIEKNIFLIPVDARRRFNSIRRRRRRIDVS